jgi:hypothetical protein
LSIERDLEGVDVVGLVILAGDAVLLGLRHVKGTRSVMGEPTDMVGWINGKGDGNGRRRKLNTARARVVYKYQRALPVFI